MTKTNTFEEIEKLLPKAVKMSNEEQSKVAKLVNKRFWSLDQWKKGNDIERLVWFMGTLSAHNYWRGEQAIQEFIESALSSQKKLILGEVNKMHKRHVTDTLGEPNPENTEYDKTVNLIQMEVNGYNKAIEKVIRLLEEKE